MPLEIDMHDATTVYTVQGALDSECVSQVRGLAMDVLATSSGPQIVDASGMDFIDSSGVGFLVTLFKRARALERPVAFAGLRGQPLETLQFLKVDRVVPMYGDLDSALQAVDTAGGPDAPSD